MLGNILREAREAKRLSIQDIENQTSIRYKYIEAIEQGDYAALPDEVFVKGFIRNYAVFLNLPPTALVEQYLEESARFQEAEEKKILANDTKGAKKKTTSLSKTRSSSKTERTPFASGTDFKERTTDPSPMKRIGIIFGILICVGIGSIYYFFGSDETKTNADVAPNQTPSQVQTSARTPAPAQTAAQESVSEKTPTQTSEPAKTETSTQTQTSPTSAQAPTPASTGTVSLTAKFEARCWTQVTADGKVIYSGVADPNTTLQWSGNENIDLILGNAGAADVTYNGQALGKLGKTGEVVKYRFTHDMKIIPTAEENPTAEQKEKEK